MTDVTTGRTRRVPALVCVVFATGLLALIGPVLSSGRTPGWWIVLPVIPAVGWIALSQRLARRHFGAVVDRQFFWRSLGLVQLWSAWLVAEWFAGLIGMSTRGSAYVLFSFAVVLLFLGATALMYGRCERDRLMAAEGPPDRPS